MKFELPDLPYAQDALEPFIGAETVEVHHQTHHAGYLRKLDAALKDSPLRDKSLVEAFLNEHVNRGFAADNFVTAAQRAVA